MNKSSIKTNKLGGGKKRSKSGDTEAEGSSSSIVGILAPPPPVATSLSPNVSPNKKVVEAGVARTTTNVAQLEAEAENKDCELDVEWGDFSSACGGEEKPATSNEVLNGTASDYEAKGQETLRRLLESREMEKAQHLMKILAEKAPLPDWAK